MKQGPSSILLEKAGVLACVCALLFVVNISVFAGEEEVTPFSQVNFGRPNYPVDHSISNARTPSIVVDEDETMHVVWADDRTSYSGIYYSYSTDGGHVWGSDLRIDSVGPAYSSYLPTIALDRTGGIYNGSLYVVWNTKTTQGSKIYLTESRDGGQSWSSSVRVDTTPSGVDCHEADIAIGPAGEVYVVWYDSSVANSYQIFLAKSTDGGNTWISGIQVSTREALNMDPVVRVWKDGTIYVIWREMATAGSDILWIAGSKDDGTTWSAYVAYSGSNDEDSGEPDVLIDELGTLHLVWISRYASGASLIFYSHSTDGGQTWAGPKRVNDGLSADSFDPPKIVKRAGTLYVVWSDNRNGDKDVFCSYSEDGGSTWGDGLLNNNDIRVDDTDENGDPSDDSTGQNMPDAFAGMYGLYVVWEDYRSTTSYHVFFSSYFVSKLIVTEIRDSYDGSEEVEIFNFGGREINTTGYSLLVDEMVVIPLDSFGVIPAMEHVTIGDPLAADLQIDITLNDQAGLLQIVDKEGIVIDEVGYGYKGIAPDPLPGESTSRYWSEDGYTNAWSRDPTPTFGLINDVPHVVSSPQVVLNEVLFFPNASQDMFIELFYKGNDTINVQLDIVCNMAHTTSSIELSASRPYYVFSYEMDPAFFASIFFLDDNVYLYNSTGSLMDMVGWDTPHAQGFSVSRKPDGNGTHYGYDDTTSTEAGWRFNEIPSMPIVYIGPEYAQYVDVGESLSFDMYVTNYQSVPDYIDITYTNGPIGWLAELMESDGVTPLTDSPADGDGIPDTGLLPNFGTMNFKFLLYVPAEVPVGDLETVELKATSSANPLGSDTADIALYVYPHVEPLKSVQPDEIYHEDSGPGYQTRATVTLNVTGHGTGIVRAVPQDVIFLIDRSGSMQSPIEKFDLAKAAAKSYVDDMKLPDQGAVIFFTSSPIRKSPLSTDYDQIKADIDSEVAPSGGTQIGEAIEAATVDLIADRIPSHLSIEILLTDGLDNPGGLDPIEEAQLAADNRIRIYTVGLGPDADGALLQSIATITGGQYYYAQDPSDLEGIYKEISTVVDKVAGYDDDLTDFCPFVEDVLPPYIHYLPGTFRDPSTGLPANPDFIGKRGSMTVLQWNVSALMINESWSVSYDITSSKVGHVAIGVYPMAKVNYVKWDQNRTSFPFPQVFINVDFVAAPPRNVETFWPGSANIGLRWSTVSWPGLDHFLIYRASEPNGFTDLSPTAAYAVVPAMSSTWVDPEPGGAASNPGELYYLMRAANANESVVTSTSNTAGAWTKVFAEGVNVFSLPFGYFDWVDYTELGRVDTIEEFRAQMGATYLEYMENGSWLRVPGMGNSERRLSATEGFVVSLPSSFSFTFTGLPGAMIQYDEYAYPGFSPASDARSLYLLRNGSDVLIQWRQPAGADFYHVYYSHNRSGFFGKLGADYWEIPAGLVPSPPGPTASVLHPGILSQSREVFYMVVPWNLSLGMGSTSYSVGIHLLSFSSYHQSISIPLRPIVDGVPTVLNLSYYADNIPMVSVMGWYLQAEKRWVPHIPEMPEGAFDFAFDLTSGAELHLLALIEFAFVGI